MKRLISLFLCVAVSLTMIIVPGVTAMAETTPDYEDYIPGAMPANLFICGSGGMYDTVNIGSTGANCKLGRNSYGYYITATSTETGEGEVGTCYMGNEGANKLHGGYFTAALFSSKIKYGTNYVVSFMTRKGATSEDTAINFAVYDYSQYKLQYTSEYGRDGLALNSTDWVSFKGTIQIPASTSGIAPQFVIGLSETAPKGTAVDARIVAEENYKTSKYVPEMYIAEEVAYDIENSLVSGDDEVTAGDVLTFEAGVTNQLGLPGGLEQAFVWKAMDENRQNEVSGISIVPSEDTTTATITIEDTLTPGSYDIVAYSEAYDMAKGYTITLEAPYYYADNGNIVTEAKLNTDDTWTTDKVTTGLVNYIEVKATLEGNTEAFEWLVADKNRLSKVDDVFTITLVTTEGSEQTVKISAITGIDIKPGDYNVVAVAKDGSVKAHPINLDITGDLDVIINTFANAAPDEIEEGLETTYLSVLGLLDSNASKADKASLAKLISSAAEEEKISDITDVEDIREVLERLAALSFYNVKPEDMELIDENGDFAYSAELGIDKIDTDGVSLYELYKTAMSDDGKANVRSAVIGKDFKTVSDFIKALKEAIVINAIAYPVVNGTGYIVDILTGENMKAVSIDSGRYPDSDNKAKYHSAIAGKVLTITQIEDELNKTYETPSSGGGYGGGSGSGGSKKTAFGSDITTPPLTEHEDKESEDDISIEVKYDDVSDKHWAFPEIVFLSKLGVVNGADGRFNPEKTVTREEILKMICVAFDIKADGAQCDFEDVDKNAWYYGYVASAKENGIVNGISDTEFGIGRAVTRQDICVMVMRAAQISGDGYPESVFTDGGDVAAYAKDSVNCLNALYVINGFSDGSFRPNASCTKAQAAKIISNALHILSGISE